MVDKMLKCKYLIIGVLLSGLILLSGCSSQPVFDAKVKAASYLNPDVNNRPSPVVLSFFQLTNPTAFNGATFFALDGNSSEALGNTLIDKAVYEIQPGEKITIAFSLSPKTYFVGTVAGYRNIETAKWRDIFPVFPEKGKQKAEISLASQSLAIKQ